MAELKFSKKHKIKEDRFIESLMRFRTWVEQNTRQLSTAGAVVLVILVVGLLVFKSRQNRGVRAHHTFGKAMMAIQKRDTTTAISHFKQLVKEFNNTSHAAMSSFFLGSVYYDKKNYALAKDYFTRNTKQYGEYELLKGAALRGLGNCAVQEKDYAGAIGLYQRFLKECPQHYLVPEALLSLGECHIKQNNQAASEQAFRRVMKEYPGSAESNTARNLLASLGITPSDG